MGEEYSVLETRMSSNASAIAFSFVERLAEDLKDERLELPSFPDAVLRVQRALQSEHSSADEVVTIVSSEPALAARLLKIANSVEFRRADSEITDLRKAIARMGFNMVRTVAVSFALRQLRRKDELVAIKGQLESIWQESIETAAYCYVLARRFAKVNPDQAMLAGLLHVLGKLYIVMRANDLEVHDDNCIQDIVKDWHATIAQAITENWGLPEVLQQAVAHQDELMEPQEGSLSQIDVLQAAKILARAEQIDHMLACYPVAARIGLSEDHLDNFSQNHAEEVQRVRESLGS